MGNVGCSASSTPTSRSKCHMSAVGNARCIGKGCKDRDQRNAGGLRRLPLQRPAMMRATSREHPGHGRVDGGSFGAGSGGAMVGEISRIFPRRGRGGRRLGWQLLGRRKWRLLRGRRKELRAYPEEAKAFSFVVKRCILVTFRLHNDRSQCAHSTSRWLRLIAWAMTLPAARTWRTASRGTVVTLRAAIEPLLSPWLLLTTMKHEGMTSAAEQVELRCRRQRQCRHTLRQRRQGRTLVKTETPKGILGAS